MKTKGYLLGIHEGEGLSKGIYYLSLLLALFVFSIDFSGCAVTNKDGDSIPDRRSEDIRAEHSPGGAEAVPSDEETAAAAAEVNGKTEGVTVSVPQDAPAGTPGEAVLPDDQPEPPVIGMAPDSIESIEKIWGVKVLGIRLSAEGHLLDFRYQVSDPEKAAPLLNRQTKPHLVDEASGIKLSVPNPPKVGPLRTTGKPEAGRQYFILFSNPGGYIKKGSKVTVVVGEFRVEHLVVQ